MASEEPEVVADEPLDPWAAAGLPPDGPRTHPQPARTAETAEQRLRRCPFHKSCVCDHTVCMDGWLDEEQEFTQAGRRYSGVVRCPRCNDAREMAGELAGMRGKRR